jgi:hypothetical protein
MVSSQGIFPLWVLPWDMPFRITNFVYVTSPDTVYFLVYNSNTENFVKEINYSRNEISLFDEMIKIVVNQSNLEYKLNKFSHLKTRVVYINNTCLDLQIPNGADSAVCIEVNNNNGALKGWGKVLFYQEQDNTKKSYFLGRASLFGAILSEDHTQFECSMQKAYVRMDKILDIYQYRSINLSEGSGLQSSECRLLHANSKEKIDDMKDCLSNGGIVPKEECLYQKAYSGVNSLASLNQESKLRSCVYVY